MEKIIFAQDDGYGINKFAFRDKNGSIKFGKITSAIAEAPYDTEDMPSFEGKKYYVGDIALMEDSSRIKDILDYKEHEMFSPLLLWQAFKENKLEKEDIGLLSVGLSLAQDEFAKNFVNRISKFTVDGEKFDFTNRVVLFPQGVGARYAIDDMYYKGANDNDKNYAIIDIGQLTVDIVTVFNGKLRREAASGSSHNGIVKITQSLQEIIAGDDRVKTVLSMKELQEVLKNGVYRAYGEEYDFSKEITELKKSYTRLLMTVLKERHNNIFQKVPRIFIIGGGAYYLDMDEIKAFHGIPFKSFVIADNPEYLNAIGNLLGAEKFLAEGKITIPEPTVKEPKEFKKNKQKPQKDEIND